MVLSRKYNLQADSKIKYVKVENGCILHGFLSTDTNVEMIKVRLILIYLLRYYSFNFRLIKDVLLNQISQIFFFPMLKKTLSSSASVQGAPQSSISLLAASSSCWSQAWWLSLGPPCTWTGGRWSRDRLHKFKRHGCSFEISMELKGNLCWEKFSIYHNWRDVYRSIIWKSTI